MPPILATLARAALVMLCANSGEGLALEPTLQSIQDKVFTPLCAQCHRGEAAPHGLVLSNPQSSHGSLVGVRSAGAAERYRVHAGDPAGSYLIHKLAGTHQVGARMPFGCPATQACLDDDAIDAIRQWIADGAALSLP
jgi:hypothetical protein